MNKFFSKAKVIFSSYDGEYESHLNWFKNWIYRKKLMKSIKNNFKIDVKNVVSNYSLIGKNHIEFSPMGGVFMILGSKYFHNLPYILCVEYNSKNGKMSLYQTKIALSSYYCMVDSYIYSNIKDKIHFPKKVSSISLNFILEQLPDEDIDDFLITLKKNLNKKSKSSYVFGVSVVNLPKGKEDSIMKNFNKDIVFYNQNRTHDKLIKILKKHFDYIDYNISGYCITFSGLIDNEQRHKNEQKKLAKEQLLELKKERG